MKLSDLNPHIRYARVHRTFIDTPKRDSFCYDCRLFFVENAAGSITVNGTRHNVSNYSSFYLPPLTRYSLNLKPMDDFKIVVMDFDLVNDFSHIERSLGTATPDSFDPSISPRYELPCELSGPLARIIPEIRGQLFECTDLFLSRAPMFLEYSSALLKLCLIELIRKSRTHTARSGLCENVTAFIRENYENSALTNTDIAARFNYNPYHLSYLMKEHTGKSLHKYLIYYRIRIAKNYLLTTDYSIDEIAWRSGFCTSAYFIKIFKQETGMTPKKYRDTRFHNEL